MSRAPLTVYDKSSCGTCQKAKAYLDQMQVPYVLINIEKSPPSEDVLEALIDEDNVKASLNVRSTIYKERNLGQAQLTKAQAIVLMLEDPNLIKRPVIETEDGDLYQGFDEKTFLDFLKQSYSS